jgi:hypothetical protein
VFHHYDMVFIFVFSLLNFFLGCVHPWCLDHPVGEARCNWHLLDDINIFLLLKTYCRGLEHNLLVQFYSFMCRFIDEFSHALNCLPIFFVREILESIYENKGTP